MLRRWSLFAAQHQGMVSSFYTQRFGANFASASAEKVIRANGRRTFSYETFAAKIAVARTQRDSPFTLTEKIIYGHLEDPEKANLVEGSPLNLRADVVSVQGEAVNGLLKKVEAAGLRETAVPALLHCDRALEADDALARRAAQHGIQLVKPSSGSTHQVLLDKHAAPGRLLVGLNTGSSSPGGLGLLVGAGESEVFELLAGRSLQTRVPKVIGVMLKGELEGWSSPEDIGFELLEQLGSEGGSGAVLEYFGEGVEELSATSMASVGRVGDEVGAIASVFPYNDSVRDYLYATGRNDEGTQADRHIDCLTADKGVTYEELVKIDLSQVKARVSGGLWENGRPAVWPLQDFSSALRQHGFPDLLSGGLIGGSFEELSRAASVARQVLKLGLKAMIPFCIVPGSAEIAKAMAGRLTREVW
ncbi:hypothetical protein CYMTET_54425 [Cymbomonas tetramitiformis]|uniref:Aconitase/3-isopropylmalate dehydratase large subunit alpha/beta/alpha domain-containing protein n=1 Tax=Cymbomonas tetramitiformis TaxID=36881 RepID=A0AAE0BGR3_9CHLO|nr:hypothetical protein CYMTET_54425 [Cymbomonas tetramitiformis]